MKRFTIYLAEPMIITPETGPGRDQVSILQLCSDACGITDLMAGIGRSNRTKFRNQVIKPLLSSELIEMTIPDKPSSSKQKYRLTEKGRNKVLVLDSHKKITSSPFKVRLFQTGKLTDKREPLNCGVALWDSDGRKVCDEKLVITDSTSNEAEDRIYKAVLPHLLSIVTA